MRATKLVLALGAVWAAFPPAAGKTADAPPEEAVQLEEVMVASPRDAAETDAIPAVATVTPASKIEQEGVRNVKDLFRDQLDVSVRAAPTRFANNTLGVGRAGNEGINIRGLEGNQVLITIDGIRVPSGFAYGPFVTGRGDFLDVDGIKEVEVLRGISAPASGSDGLGGGVDFRTFDPADVLKSRQSFGGFARGGYASVDGSRAQVVGLAGSSGLWQGMILGSLRQGRETANKGSDGAKSSRRTAPNPVDYDSGYLLGKNVFAFGSAHRVGATVETQRRRQTVEVYSARADAPQNANDTIDLNARDRISRDRASLEHRFDDLDASWFQRADSRIYWQKASVEQDTLERRHSGSLIARKNRYETQIAGLSVHVEKNLNYLLPQRLSMGFDGSLTNVRGLRDGAPPPYGETFPAKPFPDTAHLAMGVFAQDEIEAGAFSIIPALRFDRYRLEPSSAGYAGPVAALSGQALAPRLGVVWRLHPLFTPYGQIARGFRAPMPDQVNNGFSNRASGYLSIGNPNLRPERADGLEAGFRGQRGAWRYSASFFDNRYADFISRQPVGGEGTPANPTVFQYVNLARARIQGAEMRAEWRLGEGWKAQGGVAYAQGKSVAGGMRAPLDAVDPLKAVFGLRYDQDAWGIRTSLIHSQGKKHRHIAEGHSAGGTAQFAPPAYVAVDVGAYWKPSSHLTINAGIDNLFDAKYWRWPDVRGLEAASGVKDAYTAPGRTFQASVRYDF